MNKYKLILKLIEKSTQYLINLCFKYRIWYGYG